MKIFTRNKQDFIYVIKVGKLHRSGFLKMNWAGFIDTGAHQQFYLANILRFVLIMTKKLNLMNNRHGTMRNHGQPFSEGHKPQNKPPVHVVNLTSFTKAFCNLFMLTIGENTRAHQK